MARINVRFISILGVVVIVISGLLAVTWYLLRTTPEEHAELGKELLEQGAFRLAVEQFGKAVSKDPQNVPLLLLYCDTLANAMVSDARTSRDYLGQIQLVWEKVLQIDPGNPEAFTKLMDLYMRFGRDLQVFGFWTYMYDRCQESLTRRPDLVEAIKYRGIAQTNRIGELDIYEPDRLLAKRDLQAALERKPDDLEVHYHLALWHVKEAEIAEKPPISPEKAAEHRGIALDVADQIGERHPDDPEALLLHARVLVALERFTAAENIVFEIFEPMLEQPTSVRGVMGFANVVLVLYSQQVAETPDEVFDGSLRRTEELLRRAQTEWPTDIMIHFGLGRVLRHLNRFDEAIEMFDKGREITVESDPINVHRQLQLQLFCMFEYADLQLRKLDAGDSDQREALIAEAEAIVEHGLTMTGEIWQIHKLQGQIAMQRRQWGVARAEFDSAIAKSTEDNAQLLLLSAQMRNRLGERGAAMERLRSLIQLVPSFLLGYSELARLHLSLRELDEAEALITAVLEIDAEDEIALRLKANVLAARDQYDEAIAIYEQLNPSENPELILPLARLHRFAGREDEARRLFEGYFDEHPAGLEVLQELINLAADNEQAMAYVETARQAGAQAKLLDVLVAQISGSGVREAALTLIEDRGSALQQHLSRYRLLKNLGQSDEALADLEAAAKLGADHPAVINAQFGEAMARQDWDEATGLARRAADQDLDLGMGNFYFGQVYSAQGQFDRAIASIQDGLRLRKVYSVGWARLGDAQLAMGDLSEAADSYQVAIKQRPSNVQALRGLARVSYRQRDHTRALEHFRKAVDYAPNDPILRAQYLTYEQDHGDPEKALEFCQELAESNPQDMKNRRALAYMLVKQERLPKAIETIDSVIEDDGPSRTNVRVKAMILAEGGDVTAGRQLLESRVSDLKDQATAADWADLGRFLFDYDQVDAGRSAYRQAIELEGSGQQMASRELADRLFRIGRLEEASALYGSLWQSSPGDQNIGMRYLESLIREEKIERAEEVLQALTQKYPNDAGTLLMGGLLAHVKGQTEDALAAYDESIEKLPHQALVYFKRAQLLMLDPEKQTQVLSDLNRALELDGDFEVARRLLAQVYVRLGDYVEAIRELQTALRRTPRDSAARRQLAGIYFQDNNLVAVRPLLEESAELFEDDATWPLMMARLERRERRYDDAIEHLRRAQELAPRPATVSQLATLLLQVHHPQEVLDLVRENAEWTATSPMLQAQRGGALAALNRFDEAKGAFARAVEISKRLGDVHRVARQVVLALGLDRAIDELAELVSGERALWVKLVMVQLESDRRDYERGLALLAEIDDQLAADADERVVYDRLLAIAQHQTGDLQSAKITYERMLETNPDDLTNLNNLAFILANDLNEAARGVGLASRAAQLVPRNATVLDTLGWTQFKAGQLDNAVQTLERSIEMQPIATTYLHLAQVLMQQGMREAARDLLGTAIRLAEETDDSSVLTRANELVHALDAD